MERPRAERARRTRVSLRACLAEGVVAEIIAALCGGGAVTAWALHLDAGPTLIGVLFALSYFSQALQFPAAWITSRFGRRKVAIWGHATSRILLLGLVPLPFLPLPTVAKQAWLLTLLSASAVLVMVGHNAWLTWVTDLVPARIRGRFFGKRTAWATFVGTSFTLLTGHWFDRARADGDFGGTLSLFAALGFTAGLVTTWLMTKQHEPGNEPDERMHLRDLRAPFVHEPTRRLLVYQALWNAAVGLTISVSAVYMLTELRVGFVGVGLYNATLALARIVSAPLWGRAIDRLGSRPILILCAAGAAVSSLLWVTIEPGQVGLLAIEAPLTGLLLAGHEIALFAIPMAVVPQKNRPVHLAAFAMVGGIAFGLASTAGGAASAMLASAAFPLGPRLLFVISSVGRLGAAFLGASLLEPHAKALVPVLRNGLNHLDRSVLALVARLGQRGVVGEENAERSAVSGM